MLIKYLIILLLSSCSKYVQVRKIANVGTRITVARYQDKGFVIESYIPYSQFWIEKDCLKFYSTGKFKFKNARQYRKFINNSKCADALKIGDTIQVGRERIVITHIVEPVNIN